MDKINEEIGYDLVISVIPDGSRVLDLGCGDGSLLYKLQQIKNVKGYGVEISEIGISLCVDKGLYCYQGDIDEGLSDYKDDSFDYVILNLTIQNTKKPGYVLREIIRIGKKVVVSFPNFGHISNRIGLLFRGTMPKNSIFPYEWYETPDIHKLSIKNFTRYCERNDHKISKTFHFSVSGNGKSKIKRLCPNLLAQYGFFVLQGY